MSQLVRSNLSCSAKCQDLRCPAATLRFDLCWVVSKWELTPSFEYYMLFSPGFGRFIQSGDENGFLPCTFFSQNGFLPCTTQSNRSQYSTGTYLMSRNWKCYLIYMLNCLINLKVQWYVSGRFLVISPMNRNGIHLYIRQCASV